MMDFGFLCAFMAFGKMVSWIGAITVGILLVAGAGFGIGGWRDYHETA